MRIGLFYSLITATIILRTSSSICLSLHRLNRLTYALRILFMHFRPIGNASDNCKSLKYSESTPTAHQRNAVAFSVCELYKTFACTEKASHTAQIDSIIISLNIVTMFYVIHSSLGFPRLVFNRRNRCLQATTKEWLHSHSFIALLTFYKPKIIQ